MNIKGKTVLVTGAGGFIGSHLAEALHKHGCKVKAFIKYNSKGSWGYLDQSPIKDKIEIILGNIRDYDTVHTATKDVDIIFHLAAQIAIPYSYHSPSETIQTNVVGTLNILQAALANNVKKFIHTSTSEVYGSPQTVPITETHPLQTQSPYSAAKAGADLLAYSFYCSFNLPVTIVRPFNTYGPRQSARAVIPTIIMQALERDAVNLGSLSPTRDFTYVADTCQGFIKAAESEKGIGQVTNLGVGKEISIEQLANTIIKLVGRKVKIKTEKERTRPEKSEVNRLCSDNSKAKEHFDWQPETNLEQGLKQTIDWIKQNIQDYKVDRYVI